MEHKNIALNNLRNGDERTLRFIFEQHYESLVNFAKSYLFNLAEAEDVVQQIFIKLWENCRTIKIEKSVEDYLFVAVKNQCLNRLESLKVRDKHKIMYVESQLTALKSNSRPNEVLEAKIAQAIENLPAQVKKIIELKYAENKKIEEIADILNVSKNTVKTQLQRGKAKLKESLAVSTSSLSFILPILF